MHSIYLGSSCILFNFIHWVHTLTKWQFNGGHQIRNLNFIRGRESSKKNFVVVGVENANKTPSQATRRIKRNKDWFNYYYGHVNDYCYDYYNNRRGATERGLKSLCPHTTTPDLELNYRLVSRDGLTQNSSSVTQMKFHGEKRAAVKFSVCLVRSTVFERMTFHSRRAHHRRPLSI